MRGGRIAVIVLALFVIAQPMTMMFAPGVAPVGSVDAADWTFTDCERHHIALSGLVLYNSIYHPDSDRCTFGPDTVGELEEEMTKQEAFDEVLRVAEVRDNEERLINTLLNSPDFAKSPVRQEAELVFADEYLNDSTKAEAITASRNTITASYEARQLDLAERYNRDMRNANQTYAQLERVEVPELLSVYVDDSEVTATDSVITFDVPSISFEDGDTAGVSYTVGETTVQIATVTVDGTTYDFRDGLVITVEDPSGEQAAVPVLGIDRTAQTGADAYHPSDDGYTAENADIVIAADGTGDYVDPYAAVEAAVDGDVVYFKEGAYTPSATIQIDTANTTVVAEPNVVMDASAQSTGFVVRDAATGTIIKGIEITNANSAFSTFGATITLEYITVSNSPYVFNSAPDNAPEPHNVDNFVAYGYDNLYASYTSEDEYSFGDNVYWERFTSFTRSVSDEQDSQRQELLDAFGDSTSGYLNDVWSQLEVDTMSITDILTYEQMFSQSFSEAFVDSRAWLDAQYMQAGMSGHSMDSTVVVEVQSGSDVMSGARTDSRVTLSAAKTYDGHIWTMNPPASGSWDVDTTYNTETLGGPVMVTYYGQTETLNDDGSISVTTEPATLAIDGEFRIVDIIDADGSSVSSVEHGGTSDVNVYEVSEFATRIETQNTRMVEFQEEIDALSGGSGSGDQCGIKIPMPWGDGICTGISNLYVSALGVVFVVVAAYSLFARGIPGIIAAIFK